MGQVYVIHYRHSVAKDLKKINLKSRKVIVKKILELAHHPYPDGVSKLQGSSGLFRVRQGAYRIIYQVKNQELIILIVKVGHRREVYRSTLTLK